jgi:pyruvate,water dikinase
MLVNGLLAGEARLISAEPVRRIREMARGVAADPKFVRLLCEGTLFQLRDAMKGRPDFLCRYHGYLEAFGDRCFGELKLESLTLHDDPLPLLHSIGQAAHLPPPRDSVAEAPSATRAAAEAEVRKRLAGRPLRSLLFHAVLRQTRARVRDRETLRLARTRVFARVRAVFLQLGRHLYALDLLTSPRDVFYLEVDELLGCLEGTATTANLRGLVALRQTEYEGYRETAPPPDRFETRGLAAQGHFHVRLGASPATPAEDRRQGVGCCRGIARGPVRLVSDPHRHRLQPGEILVAPRTDPGWITLFPSAAGLLVEQGSLLSHAAIVARELGIPTVTSLPGLMRWLRDGDWVELDGTAGSVRRLAGGELEVAHAD